VILHFVDVEMEGAPYLGCLQVRDSVTYKGCLQVGGPVAEPGGVCIECLFLRCREAAFGHNDRGASPRKYFVSFFYILILFTSVCSVNLYLPAFVFQLYTMFVTDLGVQVKAATARRQGLEGFWVQSVPLVSCQWYFSTCQRTLVCRAARRRDMSGRAQRGGG